MVAALKLDQAERQPGTWVAITGVSGAGKSTLLRLLTGVEAPMSGQILVGNTPLHDLALDVWQVGLAYADQSPSFLYATILGNLLAQHPATAAASDEEVARILRICGLEAVIKKLPQGLDTVLDSPASRLSGGQKRRLPSDVRSFAYHGYCCWMKPPMLWMKARRSTSCGPSEPIYPRRRSSRSRLDRRPWLLLSRGEGRLIGGGTGSAAAPQQTFFADLDSHSIETIKHSKTDSCVIRFFLAESGGFLLPISR